MTAPEPLMPLYVARKPGGKPLEVLIDEATGERLLADIAVALAGIRAAKSAMAALLPPPPAEPEPGILLCGAWTTGTGLACRLPAGHKGGHQLTPPPADPRHPIVTPPGEVVDAAIYCGALAPDSAGTWRECQLEDDGHILHRNAGDSVTTFTFVWEDAPDAAADSGELPRLTGVPGAMGLGGDAFWAAHPHAAAALANVPGAGLDDGGPLPCPDGPTAEHGPCARLAGHPVPHRDGHGNEWFDGGGTRAPEGLEDAAAEEYDDDDYARLARGEQAAAEIDEARSRERRSDSAVSDGEPDEPMPVSYLPLRRAALIGGGA